jgi:hypothetical protein
VSLENRIVILLALALFGCRTTTDIKATLSDTATSTEQKSEMIWFGDGFTSKTNPGSVQKIGYLRYTRNNGKTGLRPINHCTVIHGYGLSQKVAETIQGSEFLLRKFVEAYFGARYATYMMDHVCQSMFFPVFDSNDSTIFEVTTRMEKFLTNASCDAASTRIPSPFNVNENNKQRSCAIIGHSKGGAVVTNIARRCMQMTSTMGQQTCERIAEFYSATGVNQGAGAAVLLYGAKGASSLTDSLANYYVNFNWLQNVGLAGDIFGKEIATSIGLAWNVDGDEPTNPTWFDLHPGTPMEGNVPLYVINNIGIERKGWFKGDYAASGVAKVMNGAGTAKIGCGTPLDGKETTPNRLICHGFGTAVGQVHSSGLLNLFNDGLRYSKNNNRFYDPAAKNAQYLNSVTWDSYNITDGFAELSSTLGVCKRSKTFKNNCIAFDDLNHQATAGGAFEATLHMSEQLKQITP